MSSFLGAIRSITFRHTASIQTLVVKRDITTVSFDNVNEYKKQPRKRQEAIEKTIEFAKVSGLDAAGADNADLPGGFHEGMGVDRFSRLTALISNSNGQRLYFYRTTDETFWDRIHIPEDTSIWPVVPIYVGISKTDFNNKKAPV